MLIIKSTDKPSHGNMDGGVMAHPENAIYLHHKTNHQNKVTAAPTINSGTASSCCLQLGCGSIRTIWNKINQRNRSSNCCVDLFKVPNFFKKTTSSTTNKSKTRSPNSCWCCLPLKKWLKFRKKKNTVQVVQVEEITFESDPPKELIEEEQIIKKTENIPSNEKRDLKELPKQEIQAISNHHNHDKNQLVLPSGQFKVSQFTQANRHDFNIKVKILSDETSLLLDINKDNLIFCLNSLSKFISDHRSWTLQLVVPCYTIEQIISSINQGNELIVKNMKNAIEYLEHNNLIMSQKEQTKIINHSSNVQRQKVQTKHCLKQIDSVVKTLEQSKNRSNSCKFIVQKNEPLIEVQNNNEQINEQIDEQIVCLHEENRFEDNLKMVISYCRKLTSVNHSFPSSSIHKFLNSDEVQFLAENNLKRIEKLSNKNNSCFGDLKIGVFGDQKFVIKKMSLAKQMEDDHYKNNVNCQQRYLKCLKTEKFIHQILDANKCKSVILTKLVKSFSVPCSSDCVLPFGSLIIVLELCSGSVKNYYSQYKRNNCIDNTLIKLLIQMIEALDYLNFGKKFNPINNKDEVIQICHYDIKSDNILWCGHIENPTFKLTDFGCSKILNDKISMYELRVGVGRNAPEMVTVFDTKNIDQFKKINYEKVDVFCLAITLIKLGLTKNKLIPSHSTALNKWNLINPYDNNIKCENCLMRTNSVRKCVDCKDIIRQFIDIMDKMIEEDPEKRYGIKKIKNVADKYLRQTIIS